MALKGVAFKSSAFRQWKRGRVADGAGPENQRPFTGSVSSNLTASSMPLGADTARSFYLQACGFNSCQGRQMLSLSHA